MRALPPGSRSVGICTGMRCVPGKTSPRSFSLRPGAASLSRPKTCLGCFPSRGNYPGDLARLSLSNDGIPLICSPRLPI